MRGMTFLRSGSLVFLASLILNAGGFLFHSVASRWLGVDAYGTLYALIALYSLLTMPAQFIAPVIAKHAAELAALHQQTHLRALLRQIVLLFLGIALGIVALSLLLAHPLGGYLHLAPAAILLVGVMGAMSLPSVVLRAYAQGVHAFGLYACSMIAEGVGKVLALSLCFVVGRTAFGGVEAFLIGLLAGLLVITLPLLRRYPLLGVPVFRWDWRRTALTTSGTAASAFALVALGYADVLFVKHNFSAADAGLYAVASLGGKIVLYFVGFLPGVLLPYVAALQARGERSGRFLFASLLFIATCGLFGVVLYPIIGPLLLHALAGRHFDAALPLMLGYGIAMTFLAMTNALATYGIAKHRLGFAIPLILATCGTLAAIATMHPSLTVVIDELVVGNVGMALIVAGCILWQARRATA